MSPTRPIGAGEPDPLDLDAAEQLEGNEAGRLQLVRARAEKWVGATGALGGLVGTVLVVKGRDSVAEVALRWRVVAAGCLALALVALAYATYRAYQAAFGTPGALAAISPVPLAGLHSRLAAARRAESDRALTHLRSATISVLIAIALIAAGVGVTWFAPTGTTSTQSVCVYYGGQLIVETPGPPAAIRRSAAGTTVGRC